jgi:putative tryptophan/tyrosine transport system substrate-binding protein
MRRREFIKIVASSLAAAWPLAARAQQPAMPVVGFLSGASLETMHEYVAEFKRGLVDAGFSEGRNVVIEYRWAEGHNDQLPTLAADLVRRRVTAIVAFASTPAALASKDATQTIPIVFFIGTDPVKVGLVKGLARPGGNITGITIINVELFTKSLDLAHNLMPPAATIGVLVNPANAPQTASEREIVGNSEHALGRRFIVVTASTPDELEPAFATLVGERVGALVVSGETFFLTQRSRVVALANRHTLPTIYPYREYVLAGGLMSYGTHYSNEIHKVGISTGRILKGEKAADLPVQQVTKIELVINLKLAKTLNLTIPEPLIGRADEVIE